MLTLTGNTTIREEYFQTFPIVLHLLQYPIFQIGAEIIQKLSPRRYRVLLEILFILNTNLLEHLFELLLLAGGFESAVTKYKILCYTVIG